MWEFNSRSGVITQNGQGVLDGNKCYSGTGEGRNNPAMQSVHGVGPTPAGKYRIGSAYKDEHLGPVVMHLDPLPGTNTFGRDLFRIHGDNLAHDASHGCIIAPLHVRQLIDASQDRVMVVTSGGNNEIS